MRVGPTHRSIEHAIGRIGRSDRSAQAQMAGPNAEFRKEGYDRLIQPLAPTARRGARFNAHGVLRLLRLAEGAGFGLDALTHLGSARSISRRLRCCLWALGNSHSRQSGTASWLADRSTSPISTFFHWTRGCGLCPIRVQVSRTRSRTTRSTLIWEIRLTVLVPFPRANTIL